MSPTISCTSVYKIFGDNAQKLLSDNKGKVDAAKFHYPYLPVSLMLKDKFLSNEKIKNIKSPIFIMHATEDDIVPFWMGKKMYELANNPKQSYFINENNHLVTYDKKLMNNMDIFYKSIGLNE